MIFSFESIQFFLCFLYCVLSRIFHCIYGGVFAWLILIWLFERCAGAGHLRDDILHYKKEFDKCPSDDDESRSYLMDMGIKALRLVYILIFIHFLVSIFLHC